VLAVVTHRPAVEARELHPKHHQQVSYVRNGRQVSYRLFYYGSGAVGLDAALDWLDGRAGPDDVLVTSDPQWAYLRTGPASCAAALRARGPRRPAADRQRARQVPDRVDRPDGYKRFTEQLLAANPQAWRQVWTGPAAWS